MLSSQDAVLKGNWLGGKTKVRDIMESTIGATDSQDFVFSSEEIVENLPDGVAVLDSELVVQWGNHALREWCGKSDIQGQAFYSIFDQSAIVGAAVCPLRSALELQSATTGTLQAGNRYFQLHVRPMQTPTSTQLVVAISEITCEILQHQKLEAIHQAGTKLTDLKPDEIFAMDVQERIELLKDNIRHYTADVLQFEVIEIRLLEQTTGNLMPLLSVGIDQKAADRELFAKPDGYGVTGYVASTGKSYLCRDACSDRRFIEGFQGSKSSLTVPLMLHEQIIGTINVESEDTNAFDTSDMQFLEIFARDVAMALNTLELLVAQKTNAAQQSCDAIHAAVATPIDDILLDTVHVMERYIGHQSPVVDRLQRILRNARDIKRSIQQIGQRMAPLETWIDGAQLRFHHKLRGQRILVVDADPTVRDEAHVILERYGCVVETAHHGDEAVLMVRNCQNDEPYNVIISDIKLPDYSGYQLMLRLQPLMPKVPMALMTGFGYDPGHSIVKARQAGLHPKAILYKPFRLEQLLSVIETILEIR